MTNKTMGRTARIALAASLAGALLCCASTAALAQGAASVPTPQATFGVAVGADYSLISYDQMVDYWKKVAATSDRAKMVDIGPTAEGTRQYMMVISSPENMRNLEKYRKISEQLTLGKDLTDEQAKALAREGKTIVWIDGGLHAPEVAHGQALIQLVYEMTSKTDPETMKFLENNILLAVHANPDGMNAFAKTYMREPVPEKRTALSTPTLEPIYAGHDDNRDWFRSNVPIIANMNKVIYGGATGGWYPQVSYNPHQTGPAGAVVFVPPFRDPVNPNHDPQTVTTLTELGYSIMSRLIAEGKPGAVSRNVQPYGMWGGGGIVNTHYPHGLLAIYTEIIGTPWPQKIPFVPDLQMPGNNIPLPIAPQSDWRMSRTIEYLMTIDRAVMDYGASNRERLLYDAYRKAQKQIALGSGDSWVMTPKRLDAAREAGKAGPVVTPSNGRDRPQLPVEIWDKVIHDPAYRAPRAYVLPADQPDFANAVDFANSLIKTGVTVQKATAPISLNGATYPAGSLVIKTDQAFRGYILDMFEPQDYPHDAQYPGGPPISPYDIAGYSLAGFMAPVVGRSLEPLNAQLEPIPGLIQVPAGRIVGSGGAGFIVDHAALSSFVLQSRLLKAKQQVSWIQGDTAVGGKTLPPGALWIPATGASRAIVERATKDLGVIAYAAPKPAGAMMTVKQPRIGLVDKYGGVMPVGWTDWLFQQYEIPFTKVFPQQLDAGNLKRSFDVLILADTVTRTNAPNPPDNQVLPEHRNRLGAFSTEKSVPALDAFVKAGGTLIAEGSSVNIAGMLNLPVKNALTKTADGKTTPLTNREFYIPGSMMKVSVDNSQPLAYGMGQSANLLFDEGWAFSADPAVKRAAWYEGKTPLYSGWAVGQDKLDGAAAVVETGWGKGKVFLLNGDVTFRGQHTGAYKFLFNGLYYGPATAGR